MGTIRDIPRSYEEADKFLGKRMNKHVCNNTDLFRNSAVPNDSIHMRLHNTIVVEYFHDGRFKLNAGGYQTVTTKQRINAALRNTGFYVGSNRLTLTESRKYGYDRRVSFWWIFAMGRPSEEFHNNVIIGENL